ncbi:MAG: hypothetical protein GOMPHAMPRED_002951 [Gomphillus americanus]|uniref:Uncharacterized protein n=1 Tax=Gomphillus americanus TaxID=1940652 RepID=A0A8H3EFQ4_9LECA|nr:MAG: hypothetical protein GOMPHAMPRED_002951 [Gomphillus americanus]
MSKALSSWFNSVRVLGLPDVKTPNGSNVAIVEWKGSLYVFFTGSRNEGVFCTTANFDKGDMQNWSKPTLITSQSVNSPAVALYDNKIYLLYHPIDCAKIYYHTFDGTKWSASTNIGLDADEGATTSPVATSYRGKLYVFWSGSGNDGVWYKTFDGKTWSAQVQILVQGKYIGIAKNTSPSVVVYKTQLYLFYNGSDGTYYAAFNGNDWTDITGLSGTIGCSFLPGTSPSVFKYEKLLLLLWNGSGRDGGWMSCFDGDGWTKQESFSYAIGGDDLAAGTTAQGYSFKNSNVTYRPFIFRTCGNNGVAMCDARNANQHIPYELFIEVADAGST